MINLPLFDDQPDPLPQERYTIPERCSDGDHWIIANRHHLYVGDNRAIRLPVTVDLWLTDPPYMTTDLRFDKEGFDVAGCCEYILTQSHSATYLASFGGIELLGEIARHWKMRFSGVWVKPNGTMRTHNAKKPRSASEPYAVYAHPQHKISDLVWNQIKYKSTPYRKVDRNDSDYLEKYEGVKGARKRIVDGYVTESSERFQTDVIYAPSKMQMKEHERTPHPTQKPIAGMAVLVQWLTNPNMVVCDPFGGSGSTLMACHIHNRICYTIEKNPLYADIVLWRCEKEGLEVKRV